MTSPYPLRGLVLAAGLGTRLKPITQHLAKPMLPFFGPNLLDMALSSLCLHGVKNVALNSHHLAQQIRDRVGAGYAGLDLIESFEASILGTGGSIPPLRSWLGEDHLLIFNGDILCDVDIAAAVKQHFDSEALATMICLSQGSSDKTPIYHDGTQVYAIGPRPALGNRKALQTTSFSGIHILSPTFMDQIPSPGPHHIIDTYVSILEKGLPVHIFLHDGLWSDLGTPQDYFKALENTQKIYLQAPRLQNIYRHALQQTPAKQRVELEFYTTLERSSAFSAGCFWFNSASPPAQLTTVEQAIILDQAPIQQATQLKQVLCGYGETIQLKL